MSWAMTAKMGIQAVGGALGAQKTNQANFQNAANNFRAEEAQWVANSGENKARGEANLQNVIRTGYKVGLLNVQQAQAKKALLAQGVNIGRNKLQMLSAATANQAAAGTIGASVDAILTDIESKAGEVEAQLDADYYQTAQNFDVQLHDLLLSGQDAMQSAKRISVQRTAMPKKVGEFEVVTNAMLNVAGEYAQAKMTLGLGEKATPAPDTSGTQGLTARDIMSAF